MSPAPGRQGGGLILVLIPPWTGTNEPLRGGAGSSGFSYRGGMWHMGHSACLGQETACWSPVLPAPGHIAL